MSNSPSTDSSIIEKGIVSYANATWLRAAVVGISGVMGVAVPLAPVTVGMLDVAITTKAQKFAERRLNLLCESWEREVRKIPPDIVDKEYIDSEEFFDLLFKAWESTKRTRHDEKISLYAKILAGALPLQDRREHSPEDYLAILTELNPQEIDVLRVLYRQQEQDPQPSENGMQWLLRIGVLEISQDREPPVRGLGQWEKVLAGCSSVNADTLEFVFLRLQRTGLINEMSGGFTDYIGGVFIITDTLRSLMRYLNQMDIQVDPHSS